MTWDGLDARALAARIGAPSVIYKPITHSVLDLAHGLGQGGAPTGTVVLAEQQTGGRGRQGRTWHSPPGGIWMAMILRPRAQPVGGALAIRAGIATVEAITAAARSLAPKLRWPNDIMVKNRKAAGVLCEARWSGQSLGWVAIGIGINVHGPVAEPVESRAVALGDEAFGISRVAILAALVPRLMALAESPAELGEGDRARFLELAVADEGQEITGIGADGALLLKRPDGSVERRTDPA